MPYYRQTLEDHAPLVAVLVKELSHPTDGPLPDRDLHSADDAPVIIEEPSYVGRLGVTVVWSAWESVAAADRGRVIMQAYTNAFGEERARTIGVAMGLTDDEYRRIRAQAAS